MSYESSQWHCPWNDCGEPVHMGGHVQCANCGTVKLDDESDWQTPPTVCPDCKEPLDLTTHEPCDCEAADHDD